MESASLATPAPRVQMPAWVPVSVTALCLAPLLFNAIGVDFGSGSGGVDPREALSLTGSALTDRMHHALAGSFLHTLLEWSAVLTATFTVVFAFAHFVIKRDVTTPAICLAMFWAASMDAFHIMAADRLISAVADNATLIPFTWAVCRVFNALILLVGVGVFTFRKDVVSPRPLWIAVIGIGFGILAYVVISACASSATLPQTTFPQAVIKRPYDLIPLALYLVAGLWVFPRFHRKYPSLFSSALMISIIPQVATQLYMIFGSPRLFDNHFNIAHFLKTVSYVVPFIGLLLDYVRTYRVEQAQGDLRRYKDQLEHEVALRTGELRVAMGKLETANQALWTEMNLAQRIQTVLLPSKLILKGYDASASMKVAADVGGDYYDAIRTRDGKQWIFIGDVSGHGVTAGLIMMMFQTAIRSTLWQLDQNQSGRLVEPSEVLNIVNASVTEGLRRISDDAYMTVTALCIDGQNVRYSGKHQDILVHRVATGRMERFETRGMWLGIMEDTREYLTNDSFQMNEGDLLFLYTDGLTEARRDGKLLELSGLIDLLQSAVKLDQPLESMVQRVMSEVADLGIKDDLTLLAMRRQRLSTAAA